MSNDLDPDPDAKAAALWLSLYCIFVVGVIAGYLLWRGVL